MIAKAAIEHTLAKQRRALDEMPSGHPREITQSLPYLSDRVLLLGGMRGSGRKTLLERMLRDEYPDAWYTDFDDPRLAGFDETDFPKLDRLIADSGRGVLLLNKVDQAAGWEKYLAGKAAQGAKIIATVSLRTLTRIESGNRTEGTFVTRRIDPFSYTEFLGFTHKKGSAQAVGEYLQRGSFAEALQSGRSGPALRLYEQILSDDMIIAGGIRDRRTLQRVALHLVTRSGQTVTANKLRELLKIKAVSTAAEHMSLAEQAGLVGFVPILSDNPARQAVNPRKVYAADTAWIAFLTPDAQPDREKLFETAVYNHLRRTDHTICYTSAEGGCDFVATDADGIVRCIQTCWDEDPDRMQQKTDGLFRALAESGARKGLIVTADGTGRIARDGMEIEITDADTFLSGQA